jgi:hypothetical protein
MELDKESNNEDLKPGTSYNNIEWPNLAKDGFI